MMLKRLFRSQCGEDVWLAKNWLRLQLPDAGVFCEFGAMDGQHLSNTYWLEHHNGWRGLLVEPDPRQVIVNRPNSAVARCAVGPRGVASIGLSDGDYGYSGEHFKSNKRANVPRVPLSELLIEYGFPTLDLVSIDTEGTEVEAWRTLDLAQHRPKVAIIELVTHKMPDRSSEVIAQLASDNYRLAHRTEFNGIFVCSE